MTSAAPATATPDDGTLITAAFGMPSALPATALASSLSNFTGDTPDDDTVITTAFAASLLSIVGALFVLFNWVCFPANRIFFLKLITFLAVSNLLSATSYVISFVARTAALDGAAADAACQLQAFLMMTFETAGIYWTIAIAWTLYRQVVRKRPRVEQWERAYHVVCWGVPLVAALVLLFTNSLGGADAGGHETWCWIRGADRGDAAGYVQVAVFYLPLSAAFGFNALVYLRVGRAFRALVDEGAVDAGKERMVQLRLRLHLLAFLAVWLAPLVERTWQLIDAATLPPPLRVASTLTGCSFGLLNAMAYGCNDKTLRPWKDACVRAAARLRPPAPPPTTTVAPAARRQLDEALLRAEAQ